MEHTIYEDIAARTGGDIYIGVVGPVRTGKSTLIKRIMEELVIPNIDDPHRRDRARDELPQSGSGKTIMTAEPKFVPEEAVEISPDGKARLRVRMIDSVGYMVEGAVGASEDGNPRMVSTPWFDHEIPMTEAAEIGTKKVMDDHCSIGLVVTTDGTVTDIHRADYVAAEERAIGDMLATGKPFLVVVNSTDPGGEAAQSICGQLSGRYGVTCVAADCLRLSAGGITELLRDLLYVFPLQQVQVYLPRWMDALPQDHSVKQGLWGKLLELVQDIGPLYQAEPQLERLQELEPVSGFRVRDIDLGTGTVSCNVEFPEGLYYEVLSSRTGCEITDQAQLMDLLTELAQMKKAYMKIAPAMEQVHATGYGVVMPTAEEMKLEVPEIVRKGSAYCVKLKGSAPSIHMIRVDIDTEISPIVGDEKQSEDLISYLVGEYEGNPERMWESNIFGKSVYELVSDGLGAKLRRMPEDVQGKFRGSLTRIINEGANGLICLIL